MLFRSGVLSDDAGSRQPVLSRIGNPDITDAEIAEIQGIIRESGALEWVEFQIEAFRGKAFGLIEHGVMDDGMLAEFVRAADRVTRRVS